MNRSILLAILECVLISTSFAAPFEIRAASELPTETTTRMLIKNNRPPKVMFLEPAVLLDHTALQAVTFRSHSEYGFIFHFRFTEAGAARLAAITRENLKKHIALTCGGELLAAPIVGEIFSGSVLEIHAIVSPEDAAKIGDTIKAFLQTSK